MAFNSLDYILFLGLTFALYWPLVKWRAGRVSLLLLASYGFYALWNGLYVGLILASSLLDYVCGGAIARSQSPWAKKFFLWLSIIINLGLLGYFKYTNFFIDNISAGLGAFGIPVEPLHLDLILPVGISFYTFQSLSYTLDIYKGDLEPAKNLREFLFFVAFFAQLIAGPIVRAKEFLYQLNRRPFLSSEGVQAAVYRLLRGFIKKMIIADYLAATIVDPLFQAPDQAGGLATSVALVAFHFQVYCDFSGYTDIAIGSAGLFGFQLPENFNKPYRAHSPSDYWRRWHMTLSRFCFDSLYAPLGGSKKGEFRTAMNTMITFSVIGFWHGANWNYVLFGVYHAVAVILARVLMGFAAKARGVKPSAIEAGLKGRPLAILATNIVIIGSLPLFRSPDMPTALTIYSRLLVPDAAMAFGVVALVVLTLAIVSHFMPIRWEVAFIRQIGGIGPVLQGGLVIVVTAFVLFMASVARQSFVYFQF